MDSETAADDDAVVLGEVRSLLRTSLNVETTVQPDGVPQASLGLQSVPDGGSVKATQQDVAKELAAKMSDHIQDAIQRRVPAVLFAREAVVDQCAPAQPCCWSHRTNATCPRIGTYPKSSPTNYQRGPLLSSSHG